MLHIYGRKNSIQVIQLMWAVHEIGLEHTRHNVGGSFGGLDTNEYALLNPNRLVPTIDDNGFVLWESYAIIRYLCRRYSYANLWPEDTQQAALADQWMEWANSVFMPVFFPVFWQLIRTPESERDNKKVGELTKQSGELLRIIENQLDGKRYLLGDELTMGDIPIGSLMYKYYTLPIERPSLPAIEAWYSRLQQRPEYREHVMNPFGSSTEEWLALEKAGA